MRTQALPPPFVRLCAIESASKFGVTADQIFSHTRAGNVCRARQEVIQLLMQAGHSSPEVGRWMGMHHTSVLYAAGMTGKGLPKGGWRT